MKGSIRQPAAISWELTVSVGQGKRSQVNRPGPCVRRGDTYAAPTEKTDSPG